VRDARAVQLKGVAAPIEVVVIDWRQPPPATFGAVPAFVRGVDLSCALYQEVVSGLIGDRRHAAALMGEGSEVLGYDSQRSTDHAWGLRLQIFVGIDDVEPVRQAIHDGLPAQFRGWPTRYYRWQSGRDDVHVEVATVHDWLLQWLRFDPRPVMTIARWLSTPQQLLLEVTAGAVYRDDLGELTAVRDLLRWYPHEVWMWMMGCQWAAIARYEPLVARTAEAGDDLGSRIIAARLASEIMRLCLLQERRYAPYAKWLGTAFSQLEAAEAVGVGDILAARDHLAREKAMTASLVAVARRHNDLAVTEPVEPSITQFVTVNGAIRPYRVLNAVRYERACLGAIAGSPLLHLGSVGSIDQVEASDEVVHFSDWSQRLAEIFEQKLAETQ